MKSSIKYCYYKVYFYSNIFIHKNSKDDDNLFVNNNKKISLILSYSNIEWYKITPILSVTVTHNKMYGNMFKVLNIF